MPPVQLERIRPRSVITLVASILAVYLLTSELARVNLGTLLRTADPRWMLVALGLSALTYAGAAWQLSGFVLERLSFTRTVLAQLASSFVTLVTPAAVGGAALNVRYLQRRKIPPAVAVASVGASQVVAFVMHIVLLVIFVAITGARSNSLRPPTWAYWVLAGLVVLVLIVLAVPRGRRLLRARLGPALSQVGPRLVAMVQRPAKLAEGVGGALLLSTCYILCLAASVLAVGGHIALTSAAVVYLTGARDRLRGAHPGRARRGRGRAGRRAHRDRDGGRHRGQRGAAVPAAHLLAAGAGGLGRVQLPGAPRRHLRHRHGGSGPALTHD